MANALQFAWPRLDRADLNHLVAELNTRMGRLQQVLSFPNGVYVAGPYLLGDTLYVDTVNSLVRLPGNLTTTKQYLSQTGTGAASAAPGWAQVAFADLSGAITYAQLPTGSGSWDTGAGTTATMTRALTVAGLLTAQAGLTVSGGNVGIGAAGTAKFQITQTPGAGGTSYISLVGSGGTDWRLILGDETINNLYIGGSSLPAFFWRGNWNTAGRAHNTFQNPSGSNSALAVVEFIRHNAGDTGHYLDVTSYGGSAGDLVNIGASGLLTLAQGLSVTGGSISASGIAATVGALTATSGTVQHGTEADLTVFRTGTGGIYLFATATDYRLAMKDSGGSYVTSLIGWTPGSGAASFQGNAVSMGPLTATTVNATTLAAAYSINGVNAMDATGATALRIGQGFSTLAVNAGPATFNSTVSMGGLTATTVTATGLVLTTASAAGGAGFRLPSGTAPTTPVSGDFWYDGTNLKFQDGATTRTVTWT